MLCRILKFMAEDSRDDSLQQELKALKSLANLALHPKNPLRIVRDGALEPLYDVVQSPLKTLQHKILAMEIVSNLCRSDAIHRKLVELGDSTGLRRIIAMVGFYDDEVRAASSSRVPCAPGASRHGGAGRRGGRLPLRVAAATTRTGPEGAALPAARAFGPWEIAPFGPRESPLNLFARGPGFRAAQPEPALAATGPAPLAPSAAGPALLPLSGRAHPIRPRSRRSAGMGPTRAAPPRRSRCPGAPRRGRGAPAQVLRGRHGRGGIPADGTAVAGQEVHPDGRAAPAAGPALRAAERRVGGPGRRSTGPGADAGGGGRARRGRWRCTRPRPWSTWPATRCWPRRSWRRALWTRSSAS